jgi:hypothetical protein
MFGPAPLASAQRDGESSASVITGFGANAPQVQEVWGTRAAREGPSGPTAGGRDAPHSPG